MPIFEVEANGKSFEVDAPDMNAASSAIAQFHQPSAGLGDKLSQLWQNPPAGPSLIGLARHAYDAVKGSVDAANDMYRPAGSQITEDQAAARDVLPQQAYEAAKIFSPVTPSMRGLQLGREAVEAPTAPTTEALKAEAKRGYDAARNSGVELKPEALTNFSTQVKTGLNNDGINEILAPKTFGVLDKIASSPQGATVTTDNFRTLQRTLGMVAKSPDPTERMAAARALESLTAHLENIPEGDILRGTPADIAGVNQTIKTANANYAAAKRSDLIQGKAERGQLNADTANSGLNLDNALRQQVKSILTNPKLLRGYSDEEKAMMMQIAKGSAPANVIRHVGNLLGGGGGLGALTTAGVGAYAAGPAGVAAPLAGWALKKTGNALTAKNVAKLDELVRSRSPLAQQQFQKAIQDAGGKNATSLQLLMSAAFLQDPTGRLNRAIASYYRSGGSVPAAAEGDQDNSPRI